MIIIFYALTFVINGAPTKYFAKGLQISVMALNMNRLMTHNLCKNSGLLPYNYNFPYSPFLRTPIKRHLFKQFVHKMMKINNYMIGNNYLTIKDMKKQGSDLPDLNFFKSNPLTFQIQIRI